MHAPLRSTTTKAGEEAWGSLCIRDSGLQLAPVPHHPGPICHELLDLGIAVCSHLAGVKPVKACTVRLPLGQDGRPTQARLQIGTGTQAWGA